MNITTHNHPSIMYSVNPLIIKTKKKKDVQILSRKQDISIQSGWFPENKVYSPPEIPHYLSQKSQKHPPERSPAVSLCTRGKRLRSVPFSDRKVAVALCAGNFPVRPMLWRCEGIGTKHKGRRHKEGEEETCSERSGVLLYEMSENATNGRAVVLISVLSVYRKA